MKKYKLTDETINHNGHTLHRIQALEDFADVKVGTLGGWIESEKNLSQEGTCWVYGEAKVYDKATVFDAATILDRAEVYDRATIYDNAIVDIDAKVYNSARVDVRAIISGHTQIFEHALIRGSTIVTGYAKIHGSAVCYDAPEIYDSVDIFDDVEISGHPRIYGDAKISGNVSISGMAHVFTDLSRTEDYLCLGPIGSREDYITFINGNDNIFVTTGCFSGTLSDFKHAVKKKHGRSLWGKEYMIAIKTACGIFRLRNG